MNTATQHYLKNELYSLLKEDEEIFTFLQNSALDGLWYWDLENTEEEWMNEKFWVTLGYNPKEMPHKASAWQDIINKEDLAVAINNLQKHIENENHPYDQIVRYRHRDGSTVWIRCKGIAIRNGSGKAVRMLGAHTDITDSKKQEAALNDSLLMANERNERLKNFAYIVSHNLKSNSINMKMLLEAFITENPELRDDDIVQMLLKSSVQLNESIDHLADIINVQKKADLYLAPVNLFEVVDKVISNFKLSLEEQQMAVQIDVEPEINVMGVEAYLESIVHNLVANAIRYYREDAESYLKLTASVDENHNNIIFQVEDNGLGIDLKKYGRKIFGMYKTFHNHPDSKGIGLFITKNQIEALGGNIQVESQVGEKTTFTITLQNAE